MSMCRCYYCDEPFDIDQGGSIEDVIEGVGNNVEVCENCQEEIPYREV